MAPTSDRRSKIAALLLLALGVVFYLTFAIGEVADGDIGGVQHVPPAVLLASLLWVATRRPKVAGIALLALAILVGVLYIVLFIVRDLPPTWALSVVLPSVITGWLLVRSDRHEGRRA